MNSPLFVILFSSLIARLIFDIIMIAHKIHLTTCSLKLDEIKNLVFQLVYCVGGSLKNLSL